MLPSKHSSWWRRTEYVLKTSWRRLQCNIFYLPRRLKDVLKTSWRHNCKTSCKPVLKTSWKHLARRLEDVLGRCIANTSGRRLWRRKVLRWRRLQDVFKTSSRRLGKQEMFARISRKRRSSKYYYRTSLYKEFME